MKVWLDDVRTAPDGWIHARWPDEVIELLIAGGVTHLSLDHDLGDHRRGTGYDVLVRLEDAVARRGIKPPSIAVHSANPVGRARMLQAARSIERLDSGAGRAPRRPSPPTDVDGC